MLASDVITFLVGHFPLSAVDADGEGQVRYHFLRPFRLVVTEIDRRTIALFAPLDLPADVAGEAALRRLLEANLQGIETGFGSLCLNESGQIGYRDVIDLDGMGLDAFQLRFIDLSLFFEFWRSEGLPRLIEDLRRDDPSGDGFLRL